MDPHTPLERVNYVVGQVLGVDCFTAEQDYFLAKHRLHNRYLHGWGVVRGLQVSLTDASELVVAPGLAIDCAGNEIHVCAPVSLKLPSQPPRLFLVLGYTETLTAPIPIPTTPEPAEGPTDDLAYSRIREGFRLEILDLDPLKGHRGRRAGTPGCGLPHPVCLARLTRGRQGWKVERRGHRRA